MNGEEGLINSERQIIFEEDSLNEKFTGIVREGLKPEFTRRVVGIVTPQGKRIISTRATHEDLKKTAKTEPVAKFWLSRDHKEGEDLNVQYTGDNLVQLKELLRDFGNNWPPELNNSVCKVSFSYLKDDEKILIERNFPINQFKSTYAPLSLLRPPQP